MSYVPCRLSKSRQFEFFAGKEGGRERERERVLLASKYSVVCWGRGIAPTSVSSHRPIRPPPLPRHRHRHRHRHRALFPPPPSASSAQAIDTGRSRSRSRSVPFPFRSHPFRFPVHPILASPGINLLPSFLPPTVPPAGSVPANLEALKGGGPLEILFPGIRKTPLKSGGSPPSKRYPRAAPGACGWGLWRQGTRN